MSEKRIILNCVPPASLKIPVPGLSILKSWLSKNGYKSTIIYWNLIFNKIEKYFTSGNKSFFDHAVYVNYYIHKIKKESLRQSLKRIIQEAIPSKLMTAPDFYDQHMNEYVDKIDQTIEDIIYKYHSKNVLFWGFSLKMDGWIVSSIIAKKLKSIVPHIPIIIGGIDTPKEAKAFLKNFPEFDIAVWGEGEIPIIQLVDIIENGGNLSNIGNIVYRDKTSEIMTTRQNNYFPDYSDYFLQKKELNYYGSCVIPIERSRGCHWNRCKFCYLNRGYKYRLKSTEKLYEEIVYMIENYGVYEFEFLDNDFIGTDLQQFETLLKVLAKIKKIYPDFRIIAAEVITKDLNHSIIKKMYEIGVDYVQIGYESTSNNLLKKIHKKNTFASNLFYAKISTQYRRPLTFLNVITNIPDETLDDIHEAIDNLKYLRFFIRPEIFQHRLINLHVNSKSKYFPQLKNQLPLYSYTQPAYDFLEHIIDENDRWDIFTYHKTDINYMWKVFRQIEYFYLTNKHEYFISKNDAIYKYVEYVKGNEITNIEFHENSLEAKLLYLCNDQVVSFKTLTNQITCSTDNELYVTINSLKDKGLIYCNSDYSEIVAVIDIENGRAVKPLL